MENESWVELIQAQSHRLSPQEKANLLDDNTVFLSGIKFYSNLVILHVLLCLSTQRALNSNVESLWGKGHTDTSAHANVIVCRRTTSEEFESGVNMDGGRLQLEYLIVTQQLSLRSCSRHH